MREIEKEKEREPIAAGGDIVGGQHSWPTGSIAACVCGKPVAIMKLQPSQGSRLMNAGTGGEVSLQIDKSKSPHTRGSSSSTAPLPASAAPLFSSPVLALHLNFSFAQPNNIIINTFSSCRGCCEPVRRCDCARHTSAGCAGKPEQRPQTG